MANIKKIDLDTWLVGILAGVFVLNIFLITQYANSYDEYILYDFAQANTDVYKKIMFGQPYEQLLQTYDLRYYGPAYLILGNFLVQGIIKIGLNLNPHAVWHVINFSVFLGGVWIVYCLAKKIVSKKYAFWGALLFLTQPLLWGHGVMNPKDSVFMVFFLASVYLGIHLVDRVGWKYPLSEPVSTLPFMLKLRKKWPRRASILVALVGLVSLVDRLGQGYLCRPVVTSLITWMDQAEVGSLGNQLMNQLIPQADAISMTLYIDKAVQLISAVEFWFLGITALGLILLWLASSDAVKRAAFTAGIVLGITCSIRILGPAAAGLVIIYAWMSKKRVLSGWLAVYLATGLCASLLLWPYLWSAPVTRFLECVQIMANFPWSGSIRFEGLDVSAFNLPWYYLPKLLGVQLTIPLLVFSMVGIVWGVVKFKSPAHTHPLFIILLAWFLVPLVIIMVAQPNLYDNFRQLIFILPPLFVLAAFGFEQFSIYLSHPVVRNGVWVALLIPGLAAGISLHPYEYVYYNGLVGWTASIDRQYENDYWGTAVCEAGRYLDRTAPPGAVIALTTDELKQIFIDCTTPGRFDIRVDRTDRPAFIPDYGITTTRNDDDLDYFRELPVLKTIGRGKTVFAVIRAAE